MELRDGTWEASLIMDAEVGKTLVAWTPLITALASDIDAV